MSLRRNKHSQLLQLHDDRRRARERRPENVVAMINVIFLLLLYFMVAGNLHLDLKVTPPLSTAENAPPDNVNQVTLTRDGKVNFDGNTLSIEALPGIAASRIQGQPVKLSADANAEAVVVSQLLQALAKAGAAKVTLLALSREH